MAQRALRSALFGALLVLSCLLTPFQPVRAQVVQAVRWEPPATVRDQEERPICVAEAWLNWLESAPGPEYAPITDDGLYRAAQVLDGIPGEDYTGTTAQGGEAAMRTLGLVGSVTYTKSYEEALAFLLERGPVLVSGPWYYGGDTAQYTEDHFASPVGGIRGWHLYECYAYSGGVWTCRNSWGEEWGDKGDFYARADWFSVPAEHGFIDYVLPSKAVPLGGSGGGAWARAF